MNERIEKLADEAAKFSAIMALPTGESGDKLFVEKFAELIVRECLTQVDKVDAMLDDPKEKVGVSWVGLAIAKHWGIE